MYMMTKPSKIHSRPRAHFLKRMGLAGFAFFFLKGLLWLLVPWLAHSALF